MALLDLIPENYSKSQQVVEIQNGFDYTVEAIKMVKADLFNQLFVDTATWGLKAWEKALGIETDTSKTYASRRERIIAKLRGAGTTTKSMIKQVAVAYSNGEVAVIEDSANYSFKIKFVGSKGIPVNMSDLILTVDEIKPAHLSVTYEYVYNTWNDKSGMTWDEASVYTWDQLRGETSEYLTDNWKDNSSWDDNLKWKEVI